MADMLIRGMDMPKECEKILISADGSVWINAWPTRGYMRMENVYAVPLPEKHGRLGDLDALRKEFPEPEDWKDFAQAVCHITGIWATIDNAPTIVPAEGGGE